MAHEQVSELLIAQRFLPRRHESVETDNETGRLGSSLQSLGRGSLLRLQMPCTVTGKRPNLQGLVRLS